MSSSRRKDFLFLFIFLFLFLLLYKDFFFTDNIFYERDSTIIEIPTRKLCAQLYKQEGFPLWTEAYGNGQPFLANPKNAALYPSTFLYLILPFFTAFKLHYLIHVFICWLGLYYLFQSFGLSKQASFFGGSVFIFSGIFLSSFEFYNHVAALCWMPWIILFLKKPAKNNSMRIILLSFFWALMILAGTPYVLVMTFIFCLIQLIVIESQRKRKTGLIFLSLLLALLITAAQIIPAAELLEASNRKAMDTSTWSLEFIQLPNLVFPHILGNDRTPKGEYFWGGYLFDKGYPLYYSLYVGFGVILLFGLGFGKPWDKRHYFFGSALIIFFLIASGKYLPFFSLLKNLPFFSILRYPVKYMAGCVFCLSFIAAFGFDRLCILKNFPKKLVSWFSGIAFLTLFLFILFKKNILDFLKRFFFIENDILILHIEKYLWHGLIVFILCASVILIYLYLKSGRKLLMWMLVFIIIIDLLIANRYINPVVSHSFFSEPSFLETQRKSVKIYRENRLPEDIEKELNNLQFYNYLRQSLYTFCGLGYGVEYIFNRDFFGIYDKRYHEILEFIKNSPERLIKMLRYHGVGFYIGINPIPHMPGSMKIIEEYPIYFQKIYGSCKPPYLIYDTVKAQTFDERLKIFFDNKFSPFNKAITEENLDLGNANNNEFPQKIIQLKEGSGSRTWSVSTPRKALLVWPHTLFPGWKAWIDGKKTVVVQTNLASIGVIVPPGKHEIRLKYFPSSFKWGFIISIAGFVLIIILYTRVKIKSMRVKK